MRADQDDFVGTFGAGNFCDGVVNLDGSVAEAIGKFDFHFHGAALQ